MDLDLEKIWIIYINMDFDKDWDYFLSSDEDETRNIDDIIQSIPSIDKLFTLIQRKRSDEANLIQMYQKHYRRRFQHMLESRVIARATPEKEGPEQEVL